MAITRCPYCHAITDEADKYCNNCGTQLLFPEDEEIEEEIPGEKILDAETEEKDYEIEEPEEIDLEDLIEEETVKAAAVEEPKKNGPAEEGSREDELDEEAEEREEAEEEEEEDEVGGEVIVLDEAELAADRESVFPEAGPEAEEKLREEDAPAPEEGASAGPVPPTFDTVELEGMGKTVELGKDKVEQLLEAMADAKAPEETAREGTREPTGTLPPWASVMKGAPAFSDVKDTGEIEPKSVEAAPWDIGEEEIFPRKKLSDSTIGFPERVTQAALPFEAPSAEEEVEQGAEEELAAREAVEEERVEEAVEETVEEERRGFLRTDRRDAPPVRETEPEGVETAEEREEPGERPPFNISAYLKSKAFDVLFVGLFWVVALWLAAHAMGATLFGILAAMSGSMLLLYAVLVLIYFFFFKFFLGETLGERLFRGRP